MKAYDLIVVGAGPAGIFACYEMTLLHPNAKFYSSTKAMIFTIAVARSWKTKSSYARLRLVKRSSQVVCLHVPLPLVSAVPVLIVTANSTSQPNSAAG